MRRKISARNFANENNKGSSKAMSAVDAFGPQEATMFARKMLEEESRGNGDQMNAYERVAKHCGITARQLRRFLSGEVKDPGWRLIHGIRVGFKAAMKAKLADLNHRMAIYEEMYGSDRFQDLRAEYEALAAKVETRKGDVTQ